MDQDLVSSLEKQEVNLEEGLAKFDENEQGFDSKLAFDQELLKKINKLNLSIDKNKVFNMPSAFNLLKRKNNIFFYVNYKEFSVDIINTSGKVFLPLVTREEIRSNLEKMKSEVRKTISNVHLGAIKILVKSHFREGINSPIKMALIDDRINDRQDCILGAARGNLMYGKFMFTVYPKFGISLKDKNLDKTLSFIHDFERRNLMEKGDKVFSITYLVSYALTNSHHSIDYKKKEYIEIEDVFSEIGNVEAARFSERDPNSTSWAIDIAKGKTILGQEQKPIVKNNKLTVNQASEITTLSQINDKIDELKIHLKEIC